MNRLFCALALGLVALSVFLLAANPATATVVYTANFDTGMQGWDTYSDGGVWNSTGGQDGGGYFSGTRTTNGPYLTPDPTSILYGDLTSNSR